MPQGFASQSGLNERLPRDAQGKVFARVRTIVRLRIQGVALS
jgi:hypothetical protein